MSGPSLARVWSNSPMLQQVLDATEALDKPPRMVPNRGYGLRGLRVTKGVEPELWAAVVRSPRDLAPRRALARALPTSHPYGQYLRASLGLQTASDIDPAGLVGSYRDQWWSELFSLVLSGACTMGCVEAVSCTGAQWRQHHRRIRSLTPLLRLTLSEADGDLPAFITSGSLDGLVALDLTRNQLGDAEVSTLAQHEGLGSLRWLNLSMNRIELAGLRAIAASPHLKQLAYLGFSGNLVPDPTPVPWHDYDGSVVGHDMPSLGQALDQEFGPLPWLQLYDWPPNRKSFR